jgi:hypothetical protein
MTNQEINERIASITRFHDKVGLKKRGLWYRLNACGYTSREEEAGRYTIAEAQEHAHPDGEPVTIHKFSTPNYAESLYACREFEKMIQGDGSDPEVYEDTLAGIVGVYDDFYEGIMFREAAKIVYATALQRCEAFLRMKGQWE